MSNSKARAIPFNTIGFVLVIVSFALLGLFVYGLAVGHAVAWAYGVAAALGVVGVVVSFRTAVKQERETTPDDEILVSANPLMPSEHRSHLEEYTDHVPPRPTEDQGLDR